MTTQFLEIAGRKFAVLPEDEYRRLVELAEDMEDEAAAEAARIRRENGEEYLPGDMVHRIIDGENALKVWREYRGFSQRELAEKAGCRPATVSELENEKEQGRVKLWQALARALAVDIDAIVPIPT